jgi:hypothetical protein
VISLSLIRNSGFCPRSDKLTKLVQDGRRRGGRFPSNRRPGFTRVEIIARFASALLSYLVRYGIVFFMCEPNGPSRRCA